jgi:hypothetical protein
MSFPTSFVLPAEAIDRLREVAGRLMRGSLDYMAVVRKINKRAGPIDWIVMRLFNVSARISYHAGIGMCTLHQLLRYGYGTITGLCSVVRLERT